MPHPLRFVFVLHDHQPVGNFDGVFEQAYRDAYLPLLEVFEPFDHLKLALHTSGSLIEWLDARHPDYLDRLGRLVAAGRIEIIGGAFYEPILAMIPRRDRIGQIRSYADWLQQRLGARIRGVWTAERVWEQEMTSDLVRAGVSYTILDDSHLKNAGLAEDQLHGYYLTEDEGNLLAVFPGSEPLRYLIPFRPVEETIDYLRGIAERRPGAVVLFADDGEKFGAWPETKRTVYDEGWLVHLFRRLSEEGGWIRPATPSEVLESVPPLGKVYLPEGSYREMTEWVMPADQQAEYVRARRELEHDPRWPQIARFVRGGFWRNFKVKYAETNEMYCRMLMVSRRLHEAEQAGVDRDALAPARTALYRGQCNCAYWHGAFGGVYLPHLRNAVYHELITADNLLDRATGRVEPWVELTADDFNLDGRPEILLSGNRIAALVAPARGGQLYELDVRSIAHNLLATLTRQPEAYHRRVLAGPEGRNDVAAVSDRVVFKQEGLDQLVQYDGYPRKSLLDHFFEPEASLAAVARGEARELGDFLNRAYEAKLRRNPDRMQVQLAAEGQVDGQSVRITKGLTLDAGAAALEIAYVLENLPAGRPLHFAVELNFAGLPDGADDRYFYTAGRQRLGRLGAQLDLAEIRELGLVDEWLGIDVGLALSRPSGVWTFPIQSVSQSEGGFELVHQSTVVMPHWLVQPDAQGRWTVKLVLALDTSRAEARHEPRALAAAAS